MPKQTVYDWKSTEEYIESIVSKYGHEAIQLNEGSLGIGDWVLISPDDKHYNIVIREVFVSSVCSGQTIRKCKTLSNKILKEIEEYRKRTNDEESEEDDTVALDTFPNDDRNFSRHFVVPKSWLIDILERLDGFNERKGVDLERFLQNYIWDETWFIYLQAKKDEVIISEEEGLDESTG